MEGIRLKNFIKYICAGICIILSLIFLGYTLKNNTENKMVITSSESPTIDNIVYITDTGTKYHRANCFCLKKSKHSMYIEDAIDEGYTYCKHCFN